MTKEAFLEPVQAAPWFSVNATCLLSIWLRQGCRRDGHLRRALWHWFKLGPLMPPEDAVAHEAADCAVVTVPHEQRYLHNP